MKEANKERKKYRKEEIDRDERYLLQCSNGIVIGMGWASWVFHFMEKSGCP